MLAEWRVGIKILGIALKYTILCKSLGPLLIYLYFASKATDIFDLFFVVVVVVVKQFNTYL